MYTVEYCDGYYIAKNGERVLDLANPEDKEFADFVCSALNLRVMRDNIKELFN